MEPPNADHSSPITHRGPAFAVWLTGLPASGKSSIAAALKPKLEAAGLTVEVLESDALRRILTPDATYDPAERDLFYRAMACLGSRLVAHGITVVFDATANRRAYRDFARSLIPRFLEVAVECPLEVCMERDFKGTYRKGQAGLTTTVPGLQDPYEPPLAPDLRLDTRTTTPDAAAELIVAALRRRQS
jgi:adenylylsulfate kinase